VAETPDQPAEPLSRMLAQVQRMQADMAAAQQALAETMIERSSGGGLVTATVSGDGELRRIRIAPEVVDPNDVEMLEDLIVAAVDEALSAARALQQEQLGSATQSLDLGGLADGLGLGGLLGQ
jgi:DNA-binding YbaB/EbfC family protein